MRLSFLALFVALTASAQLTNVTVGTANSGTGDTLFTAFTKLNTNDNWIADQIGAGQTGPRWIDEKISGLIFGSNPSANPPSRVEVEAGTGIYGLAWEHDDNADFSLQLAHGLATTNATFPNLYYQPHLHLSAKTLAANQTNVAFTLTFQIAPVSSSYSNTTVTITATNSFSFTSRHGLLSFGMVTNNLLSGKDSVVVRGNVKRIDTSTGDVGNSATVFIDSMDWHIPIDALGSYGISGD